MAGWLVVGDERRICLKRWPWSGLDLCNRFTEAVHGVQAGHIARRVVRQPHDAVGNKLHTGRKGVLWKELQNVREPPDCSIPSVGGCEWGSIIRRGDQYGMLQLESPREPAEVTGALHEGSNHEATTRMRDHIETRGLIRQFLEEHPCVLYWRTTEREMVEGEDAIAVGVLHAIEKCRVGQGAKRRCRVGECAVDEEQRAFGRDRSRFRQLA